MHSSFFLIVCFPVLTLIVNEQKGKTYLHQWLDELSRNARILSGRIKKILLLQEDHTLYQLKKKC